MCEPRYIPEVWNGDIRLDMAYGPMSLEHLMRFIALKFACPQSADGKVEIRIRLCKEKLDV